jgi:hypothetical protein
MEFTEVLKIGAQAGFPAALCIVLVWLWAKRSDHEQLRVMKIEEYVRDTLLNSVSACTNALRESAQAMERLSASVDALVRIVESMDRDNRLLMELFRQHNCPFQNEAAQQALHVRPAE